MTDIIKAMEWGIPMEGYSMELKKQVYGLTKTQL